MTIDNLWKILAEKNNNLRTCKENKSRSRNASRNKSKDMPAKKDSSKEEAEEPRHPQSYGTPQIKAMTPPVVASNLSCASPERANSAVHKNPLDLSEAQSYCRGENNRESSSRSPARLFQRSVSRTGGYQTPTEGTRYQGSPVEAQSDLNKVASDRLREISRVLERGVDRGHSARYSAGGYSGAENFARNCQDIKNLRYQRSRN